MNQTAKQTFDIYCQRPRRTWASAQQWDMVDAITGADREMLRRHPEMREFTRMAFPGEVPGLTILPGTACRVIRLSPTRRQRLFIEPGGSTEGQGVIDVDQPTAKLPKVRRRAGKSTRRA